jgi:hypothetical protein
MDVHTESKTGNLYIPYTTPETLSRVLMYIIRDDYNVGRWHTSPPKKVKRSNLAGAGQCVINERSLRLLYWRRRSWLTHSTLHQYQMKCSSERLCLGVCRVCERETQKSIRVTNPSLVVVCFSSCRTHKRLVGTQGNETGYQSFYPSRR